MYKEKFKSVFISLLCLLICSAVEAQTTTYVHPTITSDDEVCLFLSSPVNTSSYTLYAYGGDYTNGTGNPGDALQFLGQQYDGTYLYKWERPTTATGIPQTMTIYKDGSAIYDNKPFVNHGQFREVTEDQTENNTSLTETLTENKDVELKDGSKLTLTVGTDHDFYFESPLDKGFNCWMYFKNFPETGSNYDQFLNATTWPGDALTKLGQLSNGNYLYKGIQIKRTDVTPTNLIINDGQDWQSADLAYQVHGYYTNTITTKTVTSVSSYGRAYVTPGEETSSLDPLAVLNSQDEISIFYEAPAEATYTAWVWDGVHPDGYFNDNKSWPGDNFVKVGTLANGHILYKWTQNSHITEVPTSIIVCKNGSTDNDKIFNGSFTNHGYLQETTADGKTTVAYNNETVTRMSDGSYSTSRTPYGKRVIYELNVGSFTQEGTFAAAQQQLSNLKNLGIDVVWLMPVYERGTSNSPYAVKDFKSIKASYGQLSDLKNFVAAAHKLSMDVWLDFVPNHTDTANVWVKDHPEYYTKVDGKMVHPASDGKLYSEGQTAPENVVVYKDVYQLDYNTEVTDAQGNDAHNPAGRAIEDAMKYWLNETDIDGFRFDYVSSPHIPDAFWYSTLSDLKAIKPSIQFLAETDFTREKNVTPSYFHYDYAWDLNDRLRTFGTSENTYQETSDTNNPVDLAHITSKFLKDISDVNSDPMIYLTNHDKNWNETKKTLKDIWGDNRYPMTVLEFTLPGMPLIYNGQEQDGTVALNYFNDDKIQWSATSDKNMLGLIQELAYLKHTNNALNDGNNSSLRGETHILNTYTHSVLAIERKKGDEHVIAVINLSGSEQSSNILGATRGTWKKVLQGNNIKLDNLKEDVEISDDWRLENIPAHGYEIFTFTGESNKEEAGMYFVTDDSWNDATKHKMLATGSDDKYNYFRFEIEGSDIKALNNGKKPDADDPLTFKFQEFYDFLNLGTICKTDQMFAVAKSDSVQFKDGGPKSYPVTKGGNDALAFSIVSQTDDVAKFIITFARSKANPDEGRVSLEVVKNGEVRTGFYLLTPVNINSQETLQRHQWRFNFKDEDPDAVSDKYITDLNEDKRNLCSYVIDASQFDNYIPTERRAGNTIQFKIRQYAIPEGKTTPEDNANYVTPLKADKDNDKSTFDASKGDKVYSDAHWDKLEDNDAYFKILYRPDVAKYIIQLWQTGSGDDGKTRVRVSYVRKYNYAGSTIENVSASNEDVYLYNVDAQKFLYVGNRWGTMASLLYDDLGTRLNISDGVTGENSNYKLIRTRFEGAGIVPDGYMLGIDDFSYNANDDDPFNRLDSANIYCDRNNGNRWIFEKADTIDYANTYTLKLFNTKDNRFHYMIADHRDSSDPQAKTINTQVKYIAVDNKRYTAANLVDMKALQDGARPLPLGYEPRYIAWVGNGGSIKFDYNAEFAGTYDISVNYISGAKRPLKVNVGSPDGSSTDYEQTSESTGSWDNANRFETMHYTVKMQKGVNNLTFGEQAVAAPNITEIDITLSHPSDLKYGRWQLVTYKDLVAKLKNDNAELYGGTAADATFLLTDQGFTRNVAVTWNTDNGQTILDGSNTKSTVGLTKDAIGANPVSGMYWNGHITGKGCVYQDISVPMYGIYQFDAYGYYKGSPTKMYYQYATAFNDDGSVKTWSDMMGNTPLKDDAPEYKDRNTDIATGKLFYNESVLDDDPAHRTTQFIYMPQTAEGAAVDKNGNYKLRIGFYKTDDATGDYTAVDDVHLHYNGKSPFILDDSWDKDTKDSLIKQDVRENVPVYIKREFWADHWNALVLPVTVSTAQLRQIFGDGVQVASPYGLDDDNPYLIRFTPVDLTSGSNAIEAGRFYIVKPDKLVGTSQVMTITKNSENSYTTHDETVEKQKGHNVQFYNLGSHDLKAMLTDVSDLNVNTVGFHAGSSKHAEHNTIHFVGSFCKTKAPAKSYVFASDGNMYHLATEHDLGGFRFYIADDDTKSASKAIAFGSLSDDLDAVLASFNNKDTATGITDATTIDEGAGAQGNGYVYDLSGRRVAVSAETSKLPSGVYIINGKKYIKK